MHGHGPAGELRAEGGLSASDLTEKRLYVFPEDFGNERTGASKNLLALLRVEKRRQEEATSF
jgi:hypothetical protein